MFGNIWVRTFKLKILLNLNLDQVFPMKNYQIYKTQYKRMKISH